MLSNTRLYGASIAFASGVYSLWSVSTTARMVPSAWFMALLGVVVVVHGVALLVSSAHRFESASGPLMLAYSLLMLLNQALLGVGMVDDGSPMGMMDGMGGGPMAGGMSWDPGMVILALLMLASGVIMTRDRASMADETGM